MHIRHVRSLKIVLENPELLNDAEKNDRDWLVAINFVHDFLVASMECSSGDELDSVCSTAVKEWYYLRPPNHRAKKWRYVALVCLANCYE